jgi:hypothetical protein
MPTTAAANSQGRRAKQASTPSGCCFLGLPVLRKTSKQSCHRGRHSLLKASCSHLQLASSFSACAGTSYLPI